jgi:predicted DsbA family dithiol-disulfide isomerase
VMIGLSEEAASYDARGYSPERSARGRIRYARRFGMPFSYQSRQRNMATGLACRAVKAAELQSAGLAEALLRMLRFGFFTTDLLMDTPEAIRELADRVAGLDTSRLLDDLTSDAVRSAYEADRAEARSASDTGRPAVAQGKTATTDGPVRFTAPSLVFTRGDTRLVAGGWQTLEAYDVAVVNLAPEITRRGPATPAELLDAFDYGLATREVAVSCTATNDPVDTDAALAELISRTRPADSDRRRLAVATRRLAPVTRPGRARRRCWSGHRRTAA